MLAGIAAAVLIISAGVILTVELPNESPPVDYAVAATGNFSASWVSEDSDGQLDLTNGGSTDRIRAGTLTLTVVWDRLKPHHGNVHYLHGALHLYSGDQGIKKLTWRRTDIA